LIERALATDLKEIKADPRLKVATQIEIGYQGLTLNLANGDAGKSGPFGKDPRVRQALEAAIDRKALSDVVFRPKRQEYGRLPAHWSLPSQRMSRVTPCASLANRSRRTGES
jgi:ABC-type transport system substrate-binding protein